MGEARIGTQAQWNASLPGFQSRLLWKSRKDDGARRILGGRRAPLCSNKMLGDMKGDSKDGDAESDSQGGVQEIAEDFIGSGKCHGR
jgi:hypothetical protein